MKYKLPEGWNKVKLEDLVKFKNGKKAKNVETLGSAKYPLYGGNGRYGYVNEYNAENSLVIGRVGAYCGSVYKIDNKFWISDNAIEAKPISEDIILHEYLYFVLNYSNLNQYYHGTSQPLLNQKILKNIECILPPLKEQEAIADTLSILDDKIENNNKIAKNLEAQAQAIFKHWFVDFEFPNEEGKPYKSSDGEMVESELGIIPKGWKIVKLKDELEFLRGVEPGSKNYLDKKEDYNLPFYRVGEMISETNIYVKEDLLKDRIANKDDILVSFDGTVGRVRVGISGGYSSGIRKIFSKGNYFPKTFIYYLFKSKNIQDIIKQHATGTTILHASKSIDYMYIPYNKNIIKKFDGIFNKVFRKLINIQEENKKLEELRDTLLPKLISGELRIPLD